MQTEEPYHLKNQNKIFLGLLALAGVALVLVTVNRHGIVIWPDSIAYISAARNLLAGKGLVLYSGETMTLWPPFYPALLAFTARLFHTDPLFSAPAVNALAFGGTIYLAGMIIFKRINAFTMLAIVGTLAVLFSIPLFSTATAAFSDPLFFLLTTAAFLMIEVYLAKHGRASLILFAVVISLACMARYSGMIVAAWGGLLLLFFNRVDLKKKISDLFIFGCITGVPQGIWMVRNYLLTKAPAGPRLPPENSLFEAINLGAKSLLGWYLPGIKSHYALILGCISIVVVFFGVLTFRGKWKEWAAGLKQADPSSLFPLLCASFILLYGGFVVFSSIFSYVSVFEDRMWAPLYLPLCWLLLLFIQAVGRLLKKRLSGKAVNLLMTFGVTLWLVYPFFSTMNTILTLVKYGAGIGGPGWSESATVQYLGDHPDECAVYSNGPDVIYYLAGIDAKWVPNSWNEKIELSSLAGKWPPADKACLAWFRDIDRSGLFSPDELLSITRLENTITLKDGTIYIISKK
jgi:hypothetical protein